MVRLACNFLRIAGGSDAASDGVSSIRSRGQNHRPPRHSHSHSHFTLNTCCANARTPQPSGSPQTHLGQATEHHWLWSNRERGTRPRRNASRGAARSFGLVVPQCHAISVQTVQSSRPMPRDFTKGRELLEVSSGHSEHEVARCEVCATGHARTWCRWICSLTFSHPPKNHPPAAPPLPCAAPVCIHRSVLQLHRCRAQLVVTLCPSALTCDLDLILTPSSLLGLTLLASCPRLLLRQLDSSICAYLLGTLGDGGRSAAMWRPETGARWPSTCLPGILMRNRL